MLGKPQECPQVWWQRTVGFTLLTSLKERVQAMVTTDGLVLLHGRWRVVKGPPTHKRVPAHLPSRPGPQVQAMRRSKAPTAQRLLQQGEFLHRLSPAWNPRTAGRPRT